MTKDNTQAVQAVNEKSRTAVNKAVKYQVCSGGFHFDPRNGAPTQNMHIRLFREDQMGYNGQTECVYELKLDAGKTRITLDWGAVSEKSMRSMSEVFGLMADLIAGSERQEWAKHHGMKTDCGMNTDVTILVEEDVDPKLLNKRNTLLCRLYNEGISEEPSDEDLADYFFMHDGTIKHRAVKYASIDDRLKDKPGFREAHEKRKKASAEEAVKAIINDSSLTLMQKLAKLTINHKDYDFMHEPELLLQLKAMSKQELLALADFVEALEDSEG